MRIYVDEDTMAKLLVQLLRKAGHDVQVPESVAVRAARDGALPALALE